MWAGLSRIVTVVVVAYACYAALLFLGQRLLMYPGRSISVSPQAPETAGREIVRLKSGRVKAEAWFLPALSGPVGKKLPLLLFFHGNGEVIDFLPDQVQQIRKAGLHVMLVEYPGYGRSLGSPTEVSISEAAVAAYDAAGGHKDVDPARIVAFGRSLGGGAACTLSRRRPLAALILQSTFTSTRPFAHRMLLPGFLARDVFDNKAAVAAFSGPVLIVHGRYDDIIPFRHGEELARSSKSTTFIPLEAAHNDCPPDMDAFWLMVGEWLKEHKII